MLEKRESEISQPSGANRVEKPEYNGQYIIGRFTCAERKLAQKIVNPEVELQCNQKMDWLIPGLMIGLCLILLAIELGKKALARSKN